MRSGYCLFLVLNPIVWFVSSAANSQELSAQSGSGAKVCVAVVSNRTSTSLSEDRMTARLVRGASDKKITAVALESSTTNGRELRPTLENSREMKNQECDYLVLTQISDPRSHPTEPRLPEISIGGRVPSVDASDPGSVYRDTLEIDFAVFRPGNSKPVLDTRILDRPSANVSDSLMQAMDREGSRINRELKKK
jgi:hypothetical protein